MADTTFMDHYYPVLPPYLHQRRAVEEAADRQGFAWIMEMGTGKTKVCIDNAVALYRAGRIDAMLIFAPKGICGNWIHTELKKHVPSEILREAIVHEWAGGHTQRERRIMSEVVESSSRGLRIVVANIEGLSSSKRMEPYLLDLVLRHRTFLAVDESTTVKNPTAARTKILLYLAKKCPFRRIMTGYPSPQGPLDLFSQYEVVRPGCLGFTSFRAYSARYAIKEQIELKNGRRTSVVVGYRNQEDLPEKMAPHSFYAKKEDCLDLPEKIYTTRDVELTDQQRRMYDAMRKTALADIGNGERVTATQATTLLLRMHQIVCGHVTTETDQVVDIASNRARVLGDILEETDESVIVWGCYRRDLYNIAMELEDRGIPYVRYDGSTPQDARTRAVDAFQTREDDIRVFLGSPYVAGYGLTLTRATCVIYFSNSYDLEKRKQSEDRAHRIGQHHPVTYIDLVSPRTVDERILRALEKKENVAEMLSRDPRKALEGLLA